MPIHYFTFLHIYFIVCTSGGPICHSHMIKCKLPFIPKSKASVFSIYVLHSFKFPTFSVTSTGADCCRLNLFSKQRVMTQELWLKPVQVSLRAKEGQLKPAPTSSLPRVTAALLTRAPGTLPHSVAPTVHTTNNSFPSEFPPNPHGT